MKSRPSAFARKQSDGAFCVHAPAGLQTTRARVLRLSDDSGMMMPRDGRRLREVRRVKYLPASRSYLVAAESPADVETNWRMAQIINCGRSRSIVIIDGAALLNGTLSAPTLTNRDCSARNRVQAASLRGKVCRLCWCSKSSPS